MCLVSCIYWTHVSFVYLFIYIFSWCIKLHRGWLVKKTFEISARYNFKILKNSVIGKVILRASVIGKKKESFTFLFLKERESNIKNGRSQIFHPYYYSIDSIAHWKVWNYIKALRHCTCILPQYLKTYNSL